ncbi:hypothetical protein K505DRAFT_54980 [Melanomma pulvis-pyrius CBS 109.77]|uniref:Uncharacterized protein n=1 Tax=Melanomma pulvis-pyrius CBS 109.77 TaxID=1314802 RepID=A0A6A6X7K5_9PLEO|nr:hypothetical protein K505DRAFT_54980 [Melanomma pulvis-pyrius CBS 109.77]
MAAVMDTRTKYRVGSPILPTLPVNTKPLSFSAKLLWNIHLERIEEILDRNEITPRSTDVEYRFHNEIHDKHITIRTQADFKPESDITWPKAVQQIREYLNKENIHPAIEILAGALEGYLRHYPFATDIYQWNKVLLPDIYTIIDGYGGEWICIDMVYRENIEVIGNSQPTILISARDADEQHWWDDILPAVRHRVAQFPEIQVELLYLDEVRLAAAANSTSLADSFMTSAILLGASCGRSGDVETGTLGGTMRLQKLDGTDELRVGITNHHVLAKELEGEGPFTKFADPIKVDSPSRSDRDAYVADLKDRVSFFKNYSSCNFETTVQELEEALKFAENFDLNVGEVFASSGIRSVPNKHEEEYAMDWCLTRIEGRPASNIFHGNTSIGVREVTGYCSIYPDKAYRVFKKGRTTGATIGWISATQSAQQVRVLEPKHGVTVAQRGPGGIPPFRCHAMILDQPEVDRVSDFIWPGDSGSLILLNPQDTTIAEKKMRNERQRFRRGSC